VATMVSVDKLIIKAYLPLSSVGIYNLGHKFGLVMSVVVISINRAWMPNYYELMKQQGADHGGEIRRAFAVWLSAVGAICIVGSALARDVIQWATTPAYYDAWTVVPVILVGYMFQGVYFFMGGPIFYFKKTHVLPAITVGTALFNVGLNTIMIPRYGIMGAAFTNLASFALLAVVTYLVGRRYFDPRFDLWRTSLLLLAAAGASLAVRYFELSIVLRAGLVAGYLVLCIAVFPGYLIPLIRKVAQRG
jgi:O-antigen/teichoic acid export membrane protein